MNGYDISFFEKTFGLCEAGSWPAAGEANAVSVTTATDFGSDLGKGGFIANAGAAGFGSALQGFGDGEFVAVAESVGSAFHLYLCVFGGAEGEAEFKGAGGPR